MGLFDDAKTIEELIFQALGAASVCWDSVPSGVFDSTHAKEIGDEVVARIKQMAAEYHREETLHIVYDSLKKVGLNHRLAEDAVITMQNAGILFRERTVD